MTTKIEWCDETINPLGWGCYGPGGTPDNPQPCSYCYARRLATRSLRDCDLCRQFIPHWHPEQLDKPHHWKRHRRIFVQSMGDLFHPTTPEFQIELVLAQAKSCPQHTFQFLTKNSRRLKDFNPWPSNCWVGTTVTNQADADERLLWLLKVRGASVLFVSHEPLMGSIDMKGWPWPVCQLSKEEHEAHCDGGLWCESYHVDWAIIGAMTGRGAVLPEPAWVVHLEAQYQEAGGPIFEKDNLKPLCGPGAELVQRWPA